MLASIIKRLTAVAEQVEARQEIDGIIADLEKLAFADNNLRKLALDAHHLLGIQDEFRIDDSDNTARALTELQAEVKKTRDDAAALRVALKTVLDIAQRDETEDPYKVAAVARIASEALLANRSGEAVRQQLDELERTVKKEEENIALEIGYARNLNYSFARRMTAIIQHYKNFAAESASQTNTFRDDMLSWLRGMAINAESVSWAGTHREKDARLRGLVEVIEAAIKRVQEARTYGYQWHTSLKGWMQSDYPVREYKQRIHELEAEIRRLNGEDQSCRSEQEEK